MTRTHLQPDFYGVRPWGHSRTWRPKCGLSAARCKARRRGSGPGVPSRQGPDPHQNGTNRESCTHPDEALSVLSPPWEPQVGREPRPRAKSLVNTRTKGRVARPEDMEQWVWGRSKQDGPSPGDSKGEAKGPDFIPDRATPWGQERHDWERKADQEERGGSREGESRAPGSKGDH